MLICTSRLKTTEVEGVTRVRNDVDGRIGHALALGVRRGYRTMVSLTYFARKSRQESRSLLRTYWDG